MIGNYPLQIFYVLSLFFSCSYSYAYSEPEEQIVNLGFSYGKNIDGKYYDDTQSVNIGYGYNDFLYKLGLKYYKKRSRNEYITDIGAFYRLYKRDGLDFMIGVGLEGNAPTIEYQLGYFINDSISVNLSLNQILNDEEDIQNQREIVLGVIYQLPYFEQDGVEEASPSSLPKESRPFSSQTFESPTAESTNQTLYHTNSDKVTKEREKQGDSTLPYLPSPYVVKKGDWLMKINREYKFDLEEVIEKNEIKDRNIIYPGMLLY